MVMKSDVRLFKVHPGDKIMWVDNRPVKGEFLFTFDGEKVYNLFKDYPYALTADEVLLFDKENPFWAEYFKDRKKAQR